MLYSIRMRAAKGGAHEVGGQHISGAERLTQDNQVEDVAKAMVHRALVHSRGKADFIRLTIDEVPSKNIHFVTLPRVETFAVADVQEGRQCAEKLLLQAGVKKVAIARAIETLTQLKKNMRGALVVCGETGNRLDSFADRGIRVSRMDVRDETEFKNWLYQKGLTDIHVREAMVLSAKVLSAPQIIAELCWSDDPDYVTGYVGAAGVYQRITQLKEYGSWQGGRVFFVKAGTNIEMLRAYLEETPVLAVAKKGMQ